jgi:hypothetical protein
MLLDHPRRLFSEASDQVEVVVGCGGVHHRLCIGLWSSCFLKLFLSFGDRVLGYLGGCSS